MAAKLDEHPSPAKKKAHFPGPGGYNPQPIYKSDGFTKFGTGTRSGIYDERKAKFVPSPFAYKQDASFVQRSAAKFSFGSEMQRPHTSKVGGSPGPGAYAIKTLVGTESVGKTMSQKLCPSFEKPGSNKVPGPGSYTTNFKVARS